MKRRLRPAAPFDPNTFREAFAGPGQDTRTWCSMGTVGFNDGEPIVFDVDQGCPMVKVTLHPSFGKVFCRVGAGPGMSAGNGEGEWAPFVENDEVLVTFPNGSEKGGAVITSRFNNAIDAFPMDSVAGQDPTTNTFAFQRRRTPMIIEIAGPYLIRNALSGAFFNISKEGVITLKDGENSAFQISPDVIGMTGPSTQTKPPEFLLQLDLTNRHFVVQVGDAILTLSASDATPELNTLSVPGSLTIGTIGNPPLEHVLTTEAFFSLLFAVGTSLVAGPPTLTPTANAVGAAILTVLSSNVAQTVLALATAQTTPLLPALVAGIQQVFFTAGPKPNSAFGQFLPGIGSPGLLIG